MMATKVVLEARGVDFRYPDRDGFGLRDVDVEVRAGRCVALVGFNAQGKSTLCRVLGKVALPHTPARKPRSGRVFYYPRNSYERVDPYASTIASSALIVTAIVALVGDRWARGSAATTAAFLIVGALFVSTTEHLRRRLRDARYRSRVVYVTTENDMAKIALKDSWTLARAVCGHLRWALSAEEREALAERLLAWAGFRMFTQGDDETRDAATCVLDKSVVCGTLSGGQRHLVYLLRALAPVFVADLGRRWTPRVDVLILDEAFNCLDAEVRPRALRLARRAIARGGVAAIVVDQVLHEVGVLCDQAVFVHDGAIVDRDDDAMRMIRHGAARERPRHPETDRYVDAFWSLERDMKLATGKSADLPPCGAEIQAAIDDLPEIHFLGPPWDAALLERGNAVRIVGLTSQRRYNGKAAVVLSRVEGDPFRYKVRLRDSQTLAVRRANLVRLEEEGGQVATTTGPRLLARLRDYAYSLIPAGKRKMS
ncbi:hypothetical protein CTAYLR_005310 [Chrysophaeum taylorii]|uniref:ABC transporter domain-containing protein n=1 Tax=Chrysophaeum taylorii TaxID=2483200 RepID=A0AAD7UK31_9STRA|nr:hypothetical protein CTAYLR_005310 [Chrysophaeum taylorii]